MMLWASVSTAVSSPTGGEGTAAVAPGLVFGRILGSSLRLTGVGGFVIAPALVLVTAMGIYRTVTTSPPATRRPRD